MSISPARLRPTSRSSPCGRCVELTAELGASAVAVAARQTQQTGETHRRKERRGGRRRRITNGASTARGWGARGRNHRNWPEEVKQGREGGGDGRGTACTHRLAVPLAVRRCRRNLKPTA